MKNNHLKTLITLFALGSWGKTHTPPNDPGAPEAVGNQGEFVAKIEGEETRYLIDSALLHAERAPFLSLRGETIGTEPVLVLHLDSPHSKVPSDITRLANVSLPVSSTSESLISDGSNSVAITGGSLRILQVTGAGPWEIDAEVDLETADGRIAGILRTKLREG